MSHRPALPRQAKTPASADAPNSPSSSDIRELVRSNKEVVKSIQSLKDEFEGFRLCVASLEAKVDRFESALSSLAQQHSDCANDVKNIKSDIDTLKNSQLSLASSILQEVEQRERRRNNVMIFGLPEKTNGSLSERQQFDVAQISDLFGEVGLSGEKPEQSRRVGRMIDGRARPLKVKMEVHEDKQRILRCRKNLRDSSSYKHVFITNDETKMQQEEMRKLRLELKRRRALGEDVVIFNHQIRSKDSLSNFRN